MFKVISGGKFITCKGKVITFATREEAKSLADSINGFWKTDCKVVGPRKKIAPKVANKQ